MLYMFDDLNSFTREHFHQSRSLLSGQRRQKIDHYRFEREQMLGSIAYLLLRFGLKAEYGITGDLKFVFGEHGKPFLKDFLQIQFSLSHCREGVLCGILDTPIGVDIQEIETPHPRLMHRVMSEREVTLITESPAPDIAFTTFWALKESYLKYKGTGLSEEIRQLDFSGTLDSHRYEDCFCHHGSTSRCCYSFCTSTDITPAVRRLTAEELLR